MNNSNNIATELATLSPLLAGLQKVNVFTVPQGYFDTLPDMLQAIVNNNTNTALQQLHTPNTMQVPQGYFEGLVDNILQKIKAADDTDALSQQLQDVRHLNVYTVPQNYFESLSTNITKAATTPAKVVLLRSSTHWIKYAIAAVFVGVMALGAYQIIGNKKVTVPGYVAEAATIKDVDAAINSLSQEAIVSYLQAEGADVDAALVAATINTDELPTEEDYLYDEKALDNYLDNINLDELKN
jgi:hypothetical protein